MEPNEYLGWAALLLVVVLVMACCAMGAPADYFMIHVLDDQTGRGVPLVGLATVNAIRSYTDSNGYVAFCEPGLMGRRVFFNVSSDGYEFPKDGFGYRGAALEVKAGGEATIKIHRLNIAERLYRITGEGIYNDSVLGGKPAPIKEPLLNARVLGQDSCLCVVHGGRIWWFWGDTNRESYPLGHFGTSCATSELPGKGGLDPSVGVNLNYLVDQEGFSRPVFKLGTPGPVWVGGVAELKDPSGVERIVTFYSRMKDLGKKLEQGLAVLDEEKGEFARKQQLPLEEWRHPDSYVMRDGDYDYFCTPFPLMRVKADWASYFDPEAYEVYSPLKEGRTFAKGKPAEVERGGDGKLKFAWKKKTGRMGPGDFEELAKVTHAASDADWFHPRDIESGKRIVMHGGSVEWNPYRKKFVMIAVQFGGEHSLLGDVWEAEADRPEGPWETARRIVVHEKYTFYNPVQHPFFAQENGRVIYFEGTYANTFSGNPEQTPRYDYNQIMYRLDLGDERMRGR